ncbi:hypothetical protein A4R29_04230 [Mesorhizobium ciceri biovar biserrulae]|nr:hypothetical protein A4R29_04230 [Mesorhizobium ciceri biovar biserrulae]
MLRRGNYPRPEEGGLAGVGAEPFEMFAKQRLVDDTVRKKGHGTGRQVRSLGTAIGYTLLPAHMVINAFQQGKIIGIGHATLGNCRVGSSLLPL